MSHSDYVMTDPLHLSIPTVYVINLDHRVDRWETIKKQCHKCGIFPIRVSAIKASPGATGCGLSHAKVAKLALSKKEPWYLVLEDDAEFTTEQWSRFLKILPHLWERRSEWDIFTGGGNFKTDEFELKNRDPILYNIKTFSSHFWLVNSSGYNTIINYIPGGEAIDVLVVEKKCRLWSTYPYVATQAVTTSDIVPGFAAEYAQNDIKKTEDRIKEYVDKALTEGFTNNNNSGGILYNIFTKLWYG